MSYNKKIINISKVDFAIEILEDLNIPYNCEIIGKVRVMVDDYYNIRRLDYNNFVILEQLIRTKNYDFDNIFTSSKFNKDKEPDNWQMEIVREDYDERYDYDCIWWNLET